jgi:hypothetical protein
MTVNTAGGVTLAIGSTTEFTDIAGYESDSWTDVNEIEDGGQFGDEAAAINFTALADGRVRKFKGPRDAGTQTLVCGDDPKGQLLMLAAERTKFDYNIRVTLNDAITLGGDPSVHYFRAKVMSARRNVGNVSNVVKITYALGINSAILETLPT